MICKIKNKFEDAMFLQHFGLVLFIIIIGTTMQGMYGDFLTSANIEVLSMNLIFEGIIAIGMTFVIISGGIDLSVASVFPFAEIVVAKLMLDSGLSMGVAIAIALLACLFIGFLNGVFINAFRVHPMIITMGMMLTLRGLNLAITNGRSIAGFSDAFIFIGQGKIFGINIPIIFFGIVALVLGYLLKNHKYFRQFYFIGGSEKSAKTSGVNVGRVKISIYMISALLAGCAGIMAAAEYGAAHWSHGNLAELKAIAAVAIGGADLNGGKGVIGGTVLGIIFLAVVHNAFVLSGINTFWYEVVNGLMLLLAVLSSWYIQRRNYNKILSIRQAKLDLMHK